MMSRSYKNFVIFNREAKDAELAAFDIDSKLGAGYPHLVGDHYMVCFYTGYSNKSDDEAYAEQLAKCKAILNKYKIPYRICKFKD